MFIGKSEILGCFFCSSTPISRIPVCYIARFFSLFFGVYRDYGVFLYISILIINTNSKYPMKKKQLLFGMLFMSLYVFADIKSYPIEQPVILYGSTKQHLLETNEPMATIVSNRQKNLVIRLDPLHYSSYTITVTPSDGSNSATVSATSPTMTLPITNNTLDYLVTVDGGDYGLYDGVFNTRGDSVTLTDALAHRLVMNRRIVPVINAVSPIEQGIAEGSSSVTVGTASLPAGQYVLCLMHEGNVVQSVNIIKVAQ